MRQETGGGGQKEGGRMIESFFKSFLYAGRGIRWVLSSQRNMRIHLAVAFIVFSAVAWFKINSSELAMVIFAVALVMVAEMINSAMERIIDIVSPDDRPLAGLAKDVAAGAVLLAAFFSVVIGLLVFLPHVKKWLAE